MKYSQGFTEVYDFFLSAYRFGILTFSGVEVNVIEYKNAKDAKQTFMDYDNGLFKSKEISCSQPEELKSVIIAKKSWGLHINMWAEGISDWTFKKEEILKVFSDNNITVPEKLLVDFDNRIESYTSKRNRILLEKLTV